jgi:membrane protein
MKNERVVPNRFGEPAIYQEMEKLKQRRVQLEEEKNIMDTLKSNMHWEEEEEQNEQEENKDNAKT